MFSVKKTTLDNTGKMEKYTGKVREFCQSGKVGTMYIYYRSTAVLLLAYSCAKIHLPYYIIKVSFVVKPNIVAEAVVQIERVSRHFVSIDVYNIQ